MEIYERNPQKISSLEIEEKMFCEVTKGGSGVARTLSEATEEVRERVRELKRIRQRRLMTALTIICLMLCVGIGKTASVLCRPGVVTVYTACGSVIIRNGASGYVTIGVAAFVCGVLFTIISLRMKNRSRNKKDHEEKEDE